MDVVGLQDTAEIGLVGRAAAQALEGRFLVAEGLQKRERELPGVERLLGERRYGLLNLNGVHTALSQPPIGELFPCRCVISDTVDDGATCF